MKIILLLLMASTAYATSALDTASLRRGLKPLDLSRPPVCSALEREYFEFYSIDFPAIQHWIGTFHSGPYTVVGQLFQPDSSRGTIVFIHGYYDHTGLLKNIIRESLDRSYSFAAIDLPGHGLSSGKRASINDFTQYRDALRDFLAVIEPSCKGPIVLAGHSTGGSVVYEYCATVNDARINQVILVAPLIHSAYWNLGKLGYHLIRPFSSENRRWYRNSTHDTAFLAFQKHDPLGSSAFPFEWAAALYAWERRTRDYPVIATPVTIIQGDHDETVDWRYNCEFLEKKCSRCSVHYLKDARHQLLNESKTYRSRFMELFFEVVENRP